MSKMTKDEIFKYRITWKVDNVMVGGVFGGTLKALLVRWYLITLLN